MESLSDTELKSLLEALYIAKRVTVSYPPLEASRIYTGLDTVWEKFAAEAIARGLHDYAEYVPDVEGAYPGDSLEDGYDAAEALAAHDKERFWYCLTDIVTELAGIRDHGEEFREMAFEDKSPLYLEYKNRFDAITDEEDITPFINVDRITKK